VILIGQRQVGKTYELQRFKIKKNKLPSKSFLNSYTKNILKRFCINKENLWKLFIYTKLLTDPKKSINPLIISLMV